jgi:hypothetical protein
MFFADASVMISDRSLKRHRKIEPCCRETETGVGDRRALTREIIPAKIS